MASALAEAAGPFHSPIEVSTSSTDFSGWHMSVAVRRRQARLARERAQVDDQVPQDGHHPRPRPLAHPAGVLLHGVAKGNAVDAARRAGYSAPHPPGVRSLRKATIRAALDARVATAAMAASVVLAPIADVASRDLLNFLPATGRTYLLSSTTSVNHQGPPSTPRAEPGINGLTSWNCM